jgi:nicotinic acid mononucleotide adenylyltransferase
LATRAVYPGSFDPLTIAHLAIAEAARDACRLDRVDLVISRDPLGKDGRRQATLEDRVGALEAAASTRPWLAVAVTDRRHLADIARGYDVLILGADKWVQLCDPSFYDSVEHMEAALAALPRLAVAPRGEHPLPEECVRLEVDMHEVSSTAVREQGREEWRASP